MNKITLPNIIVNVILEKYYVNVKRIMLWHSAQILFQGFQI